MATATSVAEILLPEVFTGSKNFESYLTHFELLAELQKCKRTISGTKTDESQLYFALRFYLNLPEATRKSYDETLKVFR